MCPFKLVFDAHAQINKNYLFWHLLEPEGSLGRRAQKWRDTFYSHIQTSKEIRDTRILHFDDIAFCYFCFVGVVLLKTIIGFQFKGKIFWWESKTFSCKKSIQTKPFYQLRFSSICPFNWLPTPFYIRFKFHFFMYPLAQCM